MKTLNEEAARIKSEVAEIASKAFTGKTIEQRVSEAFAAITPQEYEVSEQVWDGLYRECVCVCGKNSKRQIYKSKPLKKSLADQ